MKSRSFNNLALIEDGSIVKKSSEQRDKLEKEVNFYRFAPQSIRALMPVLVAYGEDYSWYATEYFDSTTLGEAYCREALSEEVWGRVFKYLNHFLYEYITLSRESCEEELNSIFIKKALDRADSIEDEELKAIFFTGSVVNSKKYLPLVDVVKEKSKILQRVPAQVGLLHGDLCFSNILISPDQKEIKFIDPRGGFTEPDIYGPIIYDVAKIAQSAVGAYEQLFNGKYRLLNVVGEYLFDIEASRNHDAVFKNFEELIKPLEISLEDSKVLAGLMLSATPALHLEDPLRARALAIQSLLLLSGDF